ncbi:AP-4 complex subunit mu-1 [Angomonas deanei]|nr:AP-4 complex subunit mu-1 [Angomonas deanei]|eukprot:EPY37454.1 AP-4 complex subunit mu-1 [Angomonas deanei]
MTFSQFFILSAKGDKLVFKDYRNDIPKHSDEIFFHKYNYWDGVNSHAPPGDCPPFLMKKCQLLFVRRRQMLFVCTTLENQSPSMMVETVLSIVKLIRDFIGVLSEENVRRHFTLVYELLEEVQDMGITQELRTDRLKPFIFHKIAALDSYTSDTLYQRMVNADFGGEVSKKSTDAAVSVLAESEEKNEVYIDVVERLSVVFGPDTNVSRAQVDGSVVIKSFLQGTPTLFITFNNDLCVAEVMNTSNRFDSNGRQIRIDSISFSENVNWRSFANQKSVTVTPPIGETTIVNYKSTQPTFVPFRLIHAFQKVSDTRVEILVRVRSEYSAGVSSISTSVTIPLPLTTVGASAELASEKDGQTFDYRERQQELVWNIPSFAGAAEHTCKVKLTTSSDTSISECKRAGPITMYFEIPQHSTTGFSIQSLRIEERGSDYNPRRWIRNITQANSYVFRTH